MKRYYTTFPHKREYFSISVLQTARDRACLPQAGTSDIRLKLNTKGNGPAERGDEKSSRVNPLSKVVWCLRSEVLNCSFYLWIVDISIDTMLSIG
jgi:hypothetical protein